MYASFKFPIVIVKQTNGNVFIYNANTNEYVKSLTAEYVELICNDNGIVKLVQEAGAEYFDPAMVVATEVVPNAAINFTGTCSDLNQILATDFFFELGSSSVTALSVSYNNSGSGLTATNVQDAIDEIVSIGEIQNLNDVLTIGNSAGGNNIDMNNNKIINVVEINASGDLSLNPVGSINCNGKTIDMTGGEIHKVPLVHGQNNNDITFEALGTGDLILKTNNVNRLRIDDNGVFIGLPIDIQIAASDETTALTTGTAKVTFRSPAKFTVTKVRASLTTAQSSGSIFTVDINKNGTSILGTKLTIDNTELTSVTAATAATISTSNIEDDSEITIDIDQVGNGTAKGLKITIIGTRA